MTPNTPLKMAVKDIVVYFPGKLLPAMAGLITIPIYARLFRPEEYGILAVIITFTAAGGIVIGNWLTSSVMRFFTYYKRQGQLNRFYSSLLCAFALSLVCLVLLGYPLYLFTKDMVSPEVYQLLPLAGLIVAVNSLYSILQTILRADQRSKLFVGFELAQVYGGLIIGLSLAVIAGYGVKGILMGSIASMTIANLGILWWLLHHDMHIGHISISIATLREFAYYGLPGGLAQIGSWILSLSDRYIIEYFRGSVEVGLYSMGYNFANSSINLVVSSLILAIGPILINTWEGKQRESITDLLGQITRITIILLVPIVTGLSILPGPIFRLLTTEMYQPGSHVLPWISLGACLYGLSLLAYTGLIVEKKSGVMACNFLLAGASNIILNLLLVPRFGFMAAAINTTISYGVLLALNIITSTKYLPWRFPWQTLRNALLAGGMMSALIGPMAYFIQPSILMLLLSVITGAGIYSAMLILLEEFKPEEIIALKDITKPLIQWLYARFSPILERRED